MNKITATLLGALIFGAALPAMAEPDWQAIKLGHQHKREQMAQAKTETPQSTGQSTEQQSNQDTQMKDMMKQCEQMMKNK